MLRVLFKPCFPFYRNMESHLRVQNEKRTTSSRIAWITRLQSKFQNHFDQLIPGYYIVVIGVELFEYIAAEI